MSSRRPLGLKRMGFGWLVCSLVAGAALVPGTAGAFRNVQPGSPTPDFTLKSSKGDSVSLSSYKSKAVVVAFVRQGQDKSEKVLKALSSLDPSLAGKVEVLAIADDAAGADLAAWVTKTAVTFPVLLDAGGELYGKFGVKVVPTTGVVKPDGTFFEEIAGYTAGFKDEVQGKVKIALGLVTEAQLKAEEEKAKGPDVSEQRKLAERELEQARTLASRKMKDKALDPAKKAVATDETYGAAHTFLGRLLLDVSDSNADEALKHFEKALALSPKDPDAKAGAARVKALKGDSEGAIAMLQDALKLNPKPERVYYQMGLVHEKAGQFDKAADAYRKALEKLLEGKE